MKQRLWDLSAYFKDRNVRFAVKVGMATAMLAAPAFFDATRYLFIEYRGEWALISVSRSILLNGVIWVWNNGSSLSFLL